VALPDPPRLARSSSRHRGHSSSTSRRTVRFLSEWWAEILVGLLIAFGVFLLFERMQIRQTLFNWLQRGWSALLRMAVAAQSGVLQFLQSRTLSDLLGILFLAAALAIVAWRIRWRLLNNVRFTGRQCPRCGSGLHRVHRHGLDRALSVIVPVRRYRCGNPECHWSGLRFGRGHES